MTADTELLNKLREKLGEFEVKDLYELESAIGTQLGRKAPRKKPKNERTKDEEERISHEVHLKDIQARFPGGSIWFYLYDEDHDLGYMDLEDFPITTRTLLGAYDHKIVQSRDRHEEFCGCAKPHLGWIRACTQVELPNSGRLTIMGHHALGEKEHQKFVRAMVPGVQKPVWMSIDVLVTEDQYLGHVEKVLDSYGEIAEDLGKIKELLEDRRAKLKGGAS